MANIFMRFLAFLPVAIFLVTSCAAQKDIISLNSQLDTLYRQTKKDGKRFEKSAKRLKEEIKASEAEQRKIEKALKEDQESLRIDLAKLGADLVGIKEDIQTLAGRAEDNSHLLKRAIEEDTTKEDYMVSQMKELSINVSDLKSRIDKIENYFGSKASVKKQKAGLEKVSPKIGKNDKPVPEKKELTESAIYDRALGYYREGRYEGAIAGFKNFLELYPKSDLADNAYFWIGESHRDLKKYEDAILAYQKVINGYPNGNKVPIAMLHQALAFERINDKTTANLVFKKVLKDFPETKEAEIAKERLKQD
jgi:tol-pal system protein YbgF